MRTIIPDERLYKEHKKLIRDKALNWHRTTGVPVDELLSKGNSLFWDAVRDHNPDKASFRTWLWRKLDQGFGRHTKRHNKLPTSNTNDTEGLMEAMRDNRTERDINLRLALKDLSAEASELVNIVLNAPTELNELTPHKVRLLLKRLTTKKWGRRMSDAVFSEIQTTLKSI